MTDLLEAMELLTKGTTEHVAQKNTKGEWVKHKVKHPSLLERMAEAVTPSSNRTAGSAATAATRSPIDLEALFKYRTMVNAIHSWCRIEKITATYPENPVKDLERWYVARLTRTTNDDFYIRELTSWATTIRNKIDPPESFYLTGPCPICGKTEWGNMIDGGGTRAIEIRYRLDEHTDTMKDESAICHACSPVTMWVGHDAIVELADEIKEKRA